MDLYSLGIVLYEITTGRLPFEDEWPGEVMRMHLEARVTPPKAINSETPEWLNDLILKLLAKSTKERLSSAEAVIAQVRLYAFYDRDEKSALESAAAAFYGAEADEPAITRPRMISRPISRTADRPPEKFNKTYVFRLTSTRLIEEANRETSKTSPSKATVVIPLPRRAALIFEIEPPSRDFIFFGIFFASLQVFDGVFTSIGTAQMGTHMEGNPLLKTLMDHMGANEALTLVKAFAVMAVVFMTCLAKRMRWIKDLISFLSCIYLFAAIIPWLYLLFEQYHLRR